MASKWNLTSSCSKQNGVALGDAWLAFADTENRKRFQKARREGSPSAIRTSLEIDLVARLSDGELQAIGIEGGSDPRPVFIPEYFFSKTAEINLDEDAVAAFGKKFHEVRVQGEREREPPDDTPLSEPVPGPYIIDPREITAQRERERSDETQPSEPKSSDEPPIKEERDSAYELLAGKPTPEKVEEVHSPSNVRGRPSKTLEIEQAIEILSGKGVDLTKMSRRKASTETRSSQISHKMPKCDTKNFTESDETERFTAACSLSNLNVQDCPTSSATSLDAPGRFDASRIAPNKLIARRWPA